MSELSLRQKLLAVNTALDQAKVAHAFGGAIALAYYAEPRATIDIDINMFLPAAEFGKVSGLLAGLGVDTAHDPERLERDGQYRFWWGRTALDVFLSYVEFHDAMSKRRRLVPFDGEQIPILAPEHLLVCKVVFDRRKDWIDIEQMLVAAEGLGRAEVDHWLDVLVGSGSPQARRFTKLADRLLSPGHPR